MRPLLPRLASLLALTLISSTASLADETPDLPEVEFDKITLENGLEVIFHIDRSLPIVHLNQWYHVGSKNEQDGRTGFAHLFEHMMFQGSANVDGEYFTHIEEAGANLAAGGVNGTTNFDRTNYFATVPSANLEYLLWLESDRLATLLDAISQESLNNQIEVVRNERRQSYDNQPYGRFLPLTVAALFPKDHPYSWPTIGSHEDLAAASMDDVKAFFRRYYTPNNLSLVVAGDFDRAEAERLVRKYYGPIAPGPALDRPALYVPALDGEKVIEIWDRVAQDRVDFVWPVGPYFGPDEAPLDIAASILSDGLSSRLEKALVYDAEISSSTSAWQWSNEIAGLFVVNAIARPGVPLSEIEAALDAELKRLAAKGPSAEEVRRAQTKIEYEFISGLEGLGGFGGKADQLNRYNTFVGEPGLFGADLERYRAATPASIQDAVARNLPLDRRVVLRFVAETSQPATQTAELDRTQSPALGEDRTFQVPTPQRATLANGLEVIVVEDRELPKVAVNFVTRAGSVADPADQLGLASLVMSTLDMGTPTRDALAIESDLGDLGSQIFGGAGREGSQVSLQVLKRNLSPAVEILADVVRNPTFPEAELERQRKLTLDAIAQQNNSAGALAARVRPMLLFGPNHPYGRPNSGTPETLATIGTEDLQAFHRENWKPGSSALIFAGDLDLAEATRLAEATFGSWPAGKAPRVEIPAPAPAEPGRVYLVHRPDAAQTVINQAMLGPTRSVDGYAAFELVDAVWGGGGFGTRLNLNLREDKGYSYGVFSNHSNYLQGGAWWASGPVQTDKTAPAIEEFQAELRGIAGERPIGAEELEKARNIRLRGTAQDFDTLGQVAGQLAGLWLDELPLEHLQAEIDAIAAASIDDVRAATDRWVDPKGALLVLVGDEHQVAKEVEGLGIGEIVRLDAWGHPIAAR